MDPTFLITLLGTGLGLLVLVILGPRESADYKLEPKDLPGDLDAYLAQAEARAPNLRPDNGKKIAWAGQKGRKTPWSIIYIHGFSSSRMETFPLSEDVARAVGANLFLTRLTGHGRDADAMLDGSVNAWMNDALEAVRIARHLGERVLVMAMSNGALLAMLAATDPEIKGIDAMVLLSPNFKLRDWRAPIPGWPWGKYLARGIQGKTFHLARQREGLEKYWTTSMPTQSLLPLMALVKLGRKRDLAQLALPLLVFYCPHDQVVCGKTIEREFARIRSPRKQLVAVEATEDEYRHVLAGDILAPSGTEPIARKIIQFVRSLNVSK